jgi:hypothetical protein
MKKIIVFHKSQIRNFKWEKIIKIIYMIHLFYKNKINNMMK